MTTLENRASPWSLLVSSSLHSSASGSLYLDDGESLVPNATLWIELSMTGNSLFASARGSFVDSNPLANITILGVQSSVANVTFNGKAVASGWSYDSEGKILSVKGLQNVTATAWGSDWTLSWS